LLGTPSVQAAPSGTDLLAVCETALRSGFRGVKGSMCIWYVTPCDCTTVPASTLPRVCLTQPINHKRLAMEVTEVLKAIPEFQEKDAEEAAALILSEIYPCED
jgi:hypothetical protein